MVANIFRTPGFLSAAMLIFGSINMLVKKILYQTTVIVNGVEEKVRTPWACTLVMFLGEFLCLAFFYGCRASVRRSLKKQGKYDENFIRNHFQNLEEATTEKLDIESTYADNPDEAEQKMLGEEEETLNVNEKEEKEAVVAPPPTEESKPIRFFEDTDIYLPPHGGMGAKIIPVVIALSLCDLCSTTLSGIGLLYVNVSIVQILRGFVIVFTMLFSWAFLKKKPSKWNGLGVGFALIGLILVGVSAVLAGSDDAHSIGESFLGIGLTLISQLFTATQFVLEYNLLSHSTKRVSPIPPMYLVGIEGLVGAIMALGIASPIVHFIPGNDHGSYESFTNSWYKIGTSTQALCLIILYFISISFFNTCGFMVSKALSATTRSMIDALRTIIVWIVMVIVYYAAHKLYGEPVTLYSIIQIFGFGVMILGTLTYSNIRGLGEKIFRVKKYDIIQNQEANSLLNNKK